MYIWCFTGGIIEYEGNNIYKKSYYCPDSDEEVSIIRRPHSHNTSHAQEFSLIIV